MDEIIASIPGSLFTGLYILLYLICLLGGKLLTKFDGTMALRMPEPSKFPTSAIAAFTGGTTNAIRVAVFSMLDRKLLYLTESGPLVRINKIETPGNKPETPIEIIIYEFINTACSPEDILNDKDVLRKTGLCLSAHYIEFENMRLTRNSADRFWIWTITAITTGITALTGIYRIALNTSTNKPVIGLSVTLFITVSSLFFFMKPKRHGKTRLGLAYLKKMRHHFNWTKSACLIGGLPDKINPALPLSLYGPGVFAGIEAYTLFTRAFTPAFSTYFKPDGSTTVNDTGV